MRSIPSWCHQAQVLIDRFDIAAVKLGIAGSHANAEMIAR
jgi:hydroxymethylpyrimidine/phosphomethylpyrimidine kinase